MKNTRNHIHWLLRSVGRKRTTRGEISEMQDRVWSAIQAARLDAPGRAKETRVLTKVSRFPFGAFRAALFVFSFALIVFGGFDFYGAVQRYDQDSRGGSSLVQGLGKPVVSYSPVANVSDSLITSQSPTPSPSSQAETKKTSADHILSFLDSAGGRSLVAGLALLIGCGLFYMLIRSRRR